MSPLHAQNCKILYTDTDNLIYHIRCDDIYETMKHNIDRFDTSDYPIDNAYNMPRVNIRSKLHKVYTISESKIALSPYDDKRHIVPDSTDTLPWGHYNIPL